MKKGILFILVAPYGIGKTTIAQHVCGHNSGGEGFRAVVKISERPRRTQDVDVVGGQHIDVRGNTDLIGYHGYEGIVYATSLGEIQRELDNGRSPVLVSNDRVMNASLKFLLGKDRVKEVFVYRHLDEQALRTILVDRGLSGVQLEHSLVKRVLGAYSMYRDYASGLIQPDYVIVNGNLLDDTIAQFRRIARHAQGCGDANNRQNTLTAPNLHIVVAATGPFKDQALRSLELYPGGGRFILPKYVERERKDDDGVETRPWPNSPMPDHWLSYSPFRQKRSGEGNRYAVDPLEAEQLLRSHGVGFVTISDLEVARKLQRHLRGVGLEASLDYLHQPVLNVSKFSEAEQFARIEHARKLLETYQQELILESNILIPPDVDVLSVAMRWRLFNGVQRFAG